MMRTTARSSTSSVMGAAINTRSLLRATTTSGGVDDASDDGDGFSRVAVDNITTMATHYYPTKEVNSSIRTSITTHVTSQQDYPIMSWGFLWGSFVVVILFASWQVYLEHTNFKARMMGSDGNANGNMNDSPSTNNIHGGGGIVVDGEQSPVSSSDLARSRFRKLLLVAMILRACMIPVQLWSDPLWAQFVADTLPDMAFASAWTLLVSFFVQLVGIAAGTGNTTSTGMVIQMTAYVVYGVLVATYLWNPLASVLLYALLCCIYAALLGTTLFFGPRLLKLLKPNFTDRQSSSSLSGGKGLGIRLVGCTSICIFVFMARTIGFAREVVAPPKNVSWWWQYGVLELFPTILFLLMMHPNAKNMHSYSTVNTSSSSSSAPMRYGSNNNSNSGSPANVPTPPDLLVNKIPPMQHRRQGSHGSGGNYNHRRSATGSGGGSGIVVTTSSGGETVPLIKPQQHQQQHNFSPAIVYGTTTAVNMNSSFSSIKGGGGGDQQH